MEGFKRRALYAAGVTEKGRFVARRPAAGRQREYAVVEASQDASAAYFTIVNQELYAGKRKGRHAWKSLREGGLRYRELEVPMDTSSFVRRGHGNLRYRPFALTEDVTVSVDPSTGRETIRVPFSSMRGGRQVGPFTKGHHARSKQETEEMSEDNLAAAQAAAEAAGTTRIVQCEFPGTAGQLYAYYTDDPSIGVGDSVVVVSPYGGMRNTRGIHFDKELKGHPVVVKVKSVEETLEAVQRVVKWVVCRVDLDGYRRRIAAEERVEVLLEKIKRAEADARKRLELERLRELSPELGSLLDELKELRG